MGYSSAVKVRTTWKPGAVSRTKQSFAKECNINNIVKKYTKTGTLPVVQGQAIFGDFSNVADYQTQRNRINAVNDIFKSLPAELRARFNHEPSNMLAFVGDVKNYEEAVKLKLIPKDPIIEKAKADAAEAANLATTTLPKNPV